MRRRDGSWWLADLACLLVMTPFLVAAASALGPLVGRGTQDSAWWTYAFVALVLSSPAWLALAFYLAVLRRPKRRT